MNWSEKVMSYFSLKGSVYYVMDELGVLKNSDINKVCQENEILLYQCEDSIDFRLYYETNFRHFDKKERKTLVIHGLQNQFNTLPYDVVVDGIRIDFSVHRLFPYFDSAVLMKIPVSFLEELFELNKQLFSKLNR